MKLAKEARKATNAKYRAKVKVDGVKQLNMKLEQTGCFADRLKLLATPNRMRLYGKQPENHEIVKKMEGVQASDDSYGFKCGEPGHWGRNCLITNMVSNE